MKQIDYTLGLDLGSTSIGFSVLKNKDNLPCELELLGVRIFSDGRVAKTNTPLSVERRTARGTRRRRDRYIKRRERLMDHLIEYGLMPQNKSDRKALEVLNPYELRTRALDEKLPAFLLGRALFHINQRRGFQSNRRADRQNDDTSNMKKATEDLCLKMHESNARTLGEYLYTLNKDQKSTQTYTPTRVRSVTEKNKAVYSMYPTREMYKDEVRQIFAKQGLEKNVEDALLDTIFFQRPLQPVEFGACQFEDNELRAYVALPSFQKFRALQQVNQLYIQDDEKDRPLTKEEQQKLYNALLSDFTSLDKDKKLLTWAKAKSILGFKNKLKFNLESKRRKGLDADVSSARLSDPLCFGKQWGTFLSEQKNNIVTMLLDTEKEEDLTAVLQQKYALSPTNAKAVAGVNLPNGVGSLSVKAMDKIIPFLEQGMLYNQAVEQAGYTFSQKTKDILPDHYDDFIDPETGVVYDTLPYYGQALQKQVIGGTKEAKDRDFPEKYYGKINNPTVHIVLNQLRKLVNSLVEKYGHPSKIVVELARDLKMSKKQKKEIEEEQNNNTTENQAITTELQKLNIKNTYDNKMKYKLWQDLANDPVQRACPFCGKQISQERLMSDEFEIEHLLPFSRTYLDSRSNKVLSCRQCNRIKGNRSPFEAFSHNAENWNKILARVALLPENKRWKFKQDAFKKFEDEKGDVLTHMLTDTQYMSCSARQYLCFAAHPTKVYGIPGQLTAKLRHHWGLNSILSDDNQKNRTDHRHHAIDAFVVACTNRGTLQKYATQRSDYHTQEMPCEKAPHLPYDTFQLEHLQQAVDAIVISHKPDHGNPQKAIKNGKTVAKLHEETYYGSGKEGDKKDTVNLVKRVAVEEFKTKKDLEKIIDQKGTLNPILALLEGASVSEHALLIADYFKKRGVKKVRTYSERNKNVVCTFKDKSGKPYRYAIYGGNAYAEIYCPDRGKDAGKWQAEIIPQYCAHQKGFVANYRHEHAHAKLIMCLHIDDMVAYEKDGKTVIARVKKMTSGKIYLRSHLIAKEESDKLSWAASAEQLRQKNARKITVDILGRVIDPKKPLLTTNKTNG